MELFLVILFCAIGFVLLAKGGDIFVDNAIIIARKLKVPALIVGATIVSIGTTLPEILVSSIAAFNGDIALAASNATGSMLCNLTLILGLGLICVKATCNRKDYLDKFIFITANTILLILFMLDGTIQLWENIILLCMFATFMTINIIKASEGSKKINSFSLSSASEIMKESIKEEEEGKPFSWLTVVLFIVGAVAIAFGANLLVNNITILAGDYLNIPTAVIGATVVALGTSLPELITAINSIKKKNIDMSIGNVMGANIINGTFLIGFTGVLQGSAGMHIPDMLPIFISIAVVLVGLAILIIPMIVKQQTYRWQGISLVSLYVLYITYLVLTVVGVL